MVDKSADGVVIAVSGQVPDGRGPVSRLWDVDSNISKECRWSRAGERQDGPRGAAGATREQLHTLLHHLIDAITSCPRGHVEGWRTMSAFLHFDPTLGRMHG